MSSDTTASIGLQQQVLGRLARAGLSDDARNWLLKSLHPAASVECPGIPDMSLVTTVRTDFRTTVTVSAPPALPPGNNWDLLLIQTPGDVNNVFWAAGPAGVDFTLPVAPPGCAAGALANQAVAFDAPISGVVVLSGGPAFIPSTTLASQRPVARYWGWRPRYMGMTAYLVASALYDQGTVYAATFPSTSGPLSPFASASVTDLAGNSMIFDTVGFNVPMDEESLQLLSPKPYISPARAGVYLPARYDGPEVKFVPPVLIGGRVAGTDLSGAAVVAASGSSQLGQVPLTVYPWVIPGGLGVGAPKLGPWPIKSALGLAPVGAKVAPPFDTGFSDMTIGVVIFRGLASQASVTVRTMAGYETVPRVISDQRVFIRPPSDYSAGAMALYHEIVAGLEQGYPSSYNSLGHLLSVVGSVMGKVLPVVRGVVSALPIVGSIARAIPGAATSVRKAYDDGAAPAAGSAAPAMSGRQRVTTRSQSRPKKAVKVVQKKKKNKSR